MNRVQNLLLWGFNLSSYFKFLFPGFPQWWTILWAKICHFPFKLLLPGYFCLGNKNRVVGCIDVKNMTMWSLVFWACLMERLWNSLGLWVRKSLNAETRDKWFNLLVVWKMRTGREMWIVDDWFIRFQSGTRKSIANWTSGHISYNLAKILAVFCPYLENSNEDYHRRNGLISREHSFSMWHGYCSVF